MTAVRLSALVGAVLALSGSPLAGAEPPEKPKEPSEVSYYRQVRPLFVQHCQGCHQPAKKGGGYVMTSHADLLKAGEADQPGVVPGKPEESYLLEQIRPRSGGRRPEMPRGREPLSEKDVELIARWITQGAKDDTPMSDRLLIDAKHPPVYELPPVLTSLDYSPDGSLLAVSGYHEVLLHKADGSELVGRLVGLSERVQSLAFSPDGESLAVAGGSPGRFGEVQIWDVERKKLRLSVPVTFDTIYGISWSHDGSKVAFGCADNTLRALDAETGKQLLYQGAHNDWVLGTVFSKDSSYLVSISRDRSMKLTDVQTQRFIDNITSITPGALKGGLLAVARNPTKNETKVKNTAAGTDSAEKWYDELLIGGADGVPRMYKMHRTTKRVIGDDANKIREYSAMPGRVYALAFNKEGNLFAAGSSLDGRGEVRVYQTADGKVVSKLEGQYGAVYAVAFHPDGKTLASAGFDGIVRLSDPATGKPIKEFVPVPVAAPGEDKKP
jgi:WD40 repeat protein/mono/diheme cytochrome c family protein